jgi:hypothetical protein
MFAALRDKFSKMSIVFASLCDEQKPNRSPCDHLKLCCAVLCLRSSLFE